MIGFPIHLFSDWPISIHLWVYNQLGICFVLFLTYYSVECQTESLSNLCFRFAMLPIFLAIRKDIPDYSRERDLMGEDTDFQRKRGESNNMT